MPDPGRVSARRVGFTAWNGALAAAWADNGVTDPAGELAGAIATKASGWAPTVSG